MVVGLTFMVLSFYILLCGKKWIHTMIHHPTPCASYHHVSPRQSTNFPMNFRFPLADTDLRIIFPFSNGISLLPSFFLWIWFESANHMCTHKRKTNNIDTVVCAVCTAPHIEIRNYYHYYYYRRHRCRHRAVYLKNRTLTIQCWMLLVAFV